jgi:CheY-like chemotaxis protein
MKTILQVEDDPNDVFLLQHAMKKAGVLNPVQSVGDGQEAIDYLKGAGRFADRTAYPFPCLVLLDLKLPYVMGLEVLRWIRKGPDKGLTVIMLTASAERADVARAYELGASAFLTKPSEVGRLEDMMRALNSFWLIHNTLPQGEPLRRLTTRAQERVEPGLGQTDTADWAMSGGYSGGNHPCKTRITQ